MIVLTREDGCGARDVRVVLVNRSRTSLTELLAEFREAAPAANALCEEDFSEAFAAWACSRGYCESVGWDEV